jgi:hypothetical protein
MKTHPNPTCRTRQAGLLVVPLVLTALAAAPASRAQYASPPAKSFPGYLNQYLRTTDPAAKTWDADVNVRLREEDKDGAGTTDAGSNWDFSERLQDDTHNTYQLLRIMPRVGYTASSYSLFFEGRSSYSFGDERYNATAPGHNLPELDGPLDVYQAYAVIGNPKQFPLTLKIGRQELVYGDQRLVGHARWLNVPRTFDAVKLRYENPSFSVDVFTGGVVYVRHDRLNRSNDQDVFSGAYFTFPKLAQNQIVETCLFARNVARGIVTDDWSAVAAPGRMTAPQDLYTLGLRVKSKPGAYGPWDFGYEAAWQFGNRTAVFPATPAATALTAPRLTQGAYAIIAQLGRSWKTAWSPRLAVIGSIASGDDDPADGKSSTFQNLFPSNHLLYGAMDLTGLQNARNLRLAFSVKPKPNLTLAVETNIQWLDRSTDFWYNAAGAPRNFTGAAAGSGGGYRINPGYDRKLGHEIDLLAGWTFAPSAQLEVGASRYYRGKYIKQSLASVGSKDAGYLYVQLTLNL